MRILLCSLRTNGRSAKLTLNYGLRWEAQMFPDPTVAPAQTAYGKFLNDPRFPSDGTLPSDTGMWQPRIGFAWNVMKYIRNPYCAQASEYSMAAKHAVSVGSITTNGVQQQTIAAGCLLILRCGRPGRALLHLQRGPARRFHSFALPGPFTNPFPLFSGVRVFDRGYENPDIYTTIRCL
jgi:hypothetical protein